MKQNTVLMVNRLAQSREMYHDSFMIHEQGTCRSSGETKVSNPSITIQRVFHKLIMGITPQTLHGSRGGGYENQIRLLTAAPATGSV